MCYIIEQTQVMWDSMGPTDCAKILSTYCSLVYVHEIRGYLQGKYTQFLNHSSYRFCVKKTVSHYSEAECAT